jgi:selenide,water dikinase
LFDPSEHPDLLVGLGVPDDAAVYRLNDEQALIVTTDFFTPIVDDPYQYGAIAAANALSDIYAMGGRPILALNIAALPEDLPLEMTGAILRGAAEKVREAGAVIAGGHTIKDKEPKVGLAVVGLAHPDRFFRKGGARPGDHLILTKPLGTGVITTALKNDRAERVHLDGAVEWMMRLNRAGAEAAMAGGAHSATDITGFGLLGHGMEMAEAGGVSFILDWAQIPLMDGALEYGQRRIFPGGSHDNRLAFEGRAAFDESLSFAQQMLLFDAQTSGGLLLSLPESGLPAFSAEMERQGAPWWEIGQVAAYEGIRIKVRVGA